VALVVGAAGLVALGACGVLALLPAADWPAALDRARLPRHAALALALASLLGWGVVQQGTERLRDACGRVVGGLVFALLPLLLGLVDTLAGHDVVHPTTWPGQPWVPLVIRWYSPIVVAVTLVAYLTWKARPHEPGRLGRGVGLVVVVAPYVVLMMSLTFGVHAPFLDDALRDALEDLGGGALAVQLALAFVVSKPG
jgi:hypothetical protein